MTGDGLVGQGRATNTGLDVLIADIVDEEGRAPIAGIVIDRTIGHEIAVQRHTVAPATGAGEDVTLIGNAEIVVELGAAREIRRIATEDRGLRFR